MTQADLFETERPRLVQLAYGMVGSMASAEDLVQEAWLRFEGSDDIRHPSAWLRKVVTRLALDALKSARVRRETYVGPWLPEPVATPPEDPVVLAEALSLATLSVLEQLSPVERAAFLLRDVFDQDYAAIAELLDRQPAAVRQLVSRSRKHLAANRPRFEPRRDEHLALLAAIAEATQSGDLAQLEALLAEDVRFVSDGGGKALAAVKPVHGRSAVAKLLVGLVRKFGEGQQYVPAVLNHQLGLLVYDAGGALVSANLVTFAEGELTAMYAIRNPDKLAGLVAHSATTSAAGSPKHPSSKAR